MAEVFENIWFSAESSELFAGALFTVLIIVFSKWLASAHEYSTKKKQILKDAESNAILADEIDDIHEYMKNKKISKLSVLNLIVENAIHPLTVIAFIVIFFQPNLVVGILIILLVLFTFYHEFYALEEIGAKRAYIWILVFLWVISYWAITYQFNIADQKKERDKPAQTTQPAKKP